MRLALLLLVSGCSLFAQNALPNHRPPYAARPTDEYFPEQWYFDNRNAEGVRVNSDLNIRGAWERTRGEGVIVAVADDGVELDHPDLAPTAAQGLHYDFEQNIPNGNHRSASDAHGTPTAGLVAAAANNIGIVGAAPGARFASWNIYPTNTLPRRSFILPEKMANVFTYKNDEIQVQLHNWSEVREGTQFFAQTAVESASISNAVTLGRGGKGVVLVRPAGNVHYDPDRGQYFLRNVNDDGFANDPRAITVAAARSNGRVTSYSTRGAPILVSAPSGDFSYGFANIFTTDRQGTAGLNPITFPSDPDLNNYVFGSFGFTGTSASAPMIAGVCALIVSANPNLTYRDVQQILIHSSRHFDREDPDLVRNAAGYWVSHRQGFGMPDAGEAVRLADAWKNRPAMVRRVIPSDVVNPVQIPDASLRIEARALQSVPAYGQSFVAFPSLGPQPDDPTQDLPLVDVGLAGGPIAQNLAGKAALIQRGGSPFASKIGFAAAAGASFAIVYNNTDTPAFSLMGETDFVKIPAVMISRVAGETLKSNITAHPSMRVQMLGTPAVARFNMTEQLLCEHVGVRIKTTHPTRQDLRITLVSPQGTRSVLQAFNLDQTPGPVDWTYYSTHHFYELSSGLWTLEITDEVEQSVGSLTLAELIVHGTPIEDFDDDGLDDNWERANFNNSLAQGPLDDPDRDGSWNAREQILGTNPAVNETPFRLTAASLSTNAVRFAFPSVAGTNYIIRSSLDLNRPFDEIATIPGEFGETEIITDKGDPQRYFHIRRQ